MEAPARYVCTKENPWTSEKGNWTEHPDAKSVGGHDYGLGEYCVEYLCPNCGKSFEVELPQ